MNAPVDLELLRITEHLDQQFNAQEANLAKFFNDCDNSVQKIRDRQTKVAHEAITLLLGEITIFRKFEASLMFFASKRDNMGAAKITKELIEGLAAYRKGVQELSAMDEQNTDVN